MTGEAIEFLLGLYFFISPLSYVRVPGTFGKLSVTNWIHVILGLGLIILAVLGISPIR